MRILIDMNLAPAWEEMLQNAGYDATHWSRIGSADAKDDDLLKWAKDHDHVLFTHDLDFGAILAASRAESPSVLQIRTQDVAPAHLGRLVLSVFERFGHQLTQGAIVSVDDRSARVRILPL